MAVAGRQDFVPLWIEGVLSSDYEVSTLPLMFACESDFDAYYTTLCERYPRKSKEMRDMMRYSRSARELKVKGKWQESLEAMNESLNLRKKVFENEDYQLVAAQQHYCLTAVHYASQALVQQQGTTSYELFKEAKEAVEANLPTMERPFFEVMLYSNWANYWNRRGRPSSTCQSCGSALKRWRKLIQVLPPSCSEAPDFKLFTSFLLLRYGASQLLCCKYGAAQASLVEGLNCMTQLAPPVQIPAGAINATGLSFSDAPKIYLPVEKINMCVTSAYSHYDTPWPLLPSLRTVGLYNLSYANIYLLRFSAATENLEKCAKQFERSLRMYKKEGNEHWWNEVQLAFKHCSTVLSSGKKIRVDHWNSHHRGLQTIFMQDHQRGVSKANSHIDEEQKDESTEVWEKLVPCLKKKMTFKHAMKTMDGMAVKMKQDPQIISLANKIKEKQDLTKVKKRVKEAQESEGVQGQGLWNSKFTLHSSNKRYIATFPNTTQQRTVVKKTRSHATSPVHEEVAEEKEKELSPRQILKDSLFELYCPSQEVAEDPAYEAAKMRLSGISQREHVLTEYASSLERELSRVAKQKDDVASTRKKLELICEKGPVKPEKKPPQIEEPKEVDVAPKEIPAYCDTAAQKAPPVLDNLNKITNRFMHGFGKAKTPEPAMDNTSEGSDESFCDKLSSVYGRRQKMCRSTSPKSDAFKRPKSFVNSRSAGERQQRLRTLLPHLDQHGEMYRMVTKELASNQQVLTCRAKERRLQRMVEVAKKGRIALHIGSDVKKNIIADREALRNARWVFSATLAVAATLDSASMLSTQETATLGDTATELGCGDETPVLHEDAVPVPPV